MELRIAVVVYYIIIMTILVNTKPDIVDYYKSSDTALVERLEFAIEVRKYVKEFEEESGYRAFNRIELINSDLMDDKAYAGLSLIHESDRKYGPIIINTTYWRNMNEWQRSLLIWHELTHSILEKGHDRVIRDKKGCGATLMDPYIVKGYCARAQWQAFKAQIRGYSDRKAK